MSDKTTIVKEEESWLYSSRAMLNGIFFILLIFLVNSCQTGLSRFVIKIAPCDENHVGDHRTDFDGNLWECVRVERRDTRSFSYVVGGRL